MRRKELISENPDYTFSEATVIMGKDWTMLDPKLKVRLVGYICKSNVYSLSLDELDVFNFCGSFFD